MGSKPRWSALKGLVIIRLLDLLQVVTEYKAAFITGSCSVKVEIECTKRFGNNTAVGSTTGRD